MCVAGTIICLYSLYAWACWDSQFLTGYMFHLLSSCEGPAAQVDCNMELSII
jgi:hypothetical protein